MPMPSPPPRQTICTFIFRGGLRLPAFAEDWEYLASTLIRWVADAPVAAVFNAGLAYRKSELLLAYHRDSSLGASIYFNPKGMVSMGYSYQFPTPSLLSKLNSGNHEIILRFRFKNNKKEPSEMEELDPSSDDIAMK